VESPGVSLSETADSTGSGKIFSDGGVGQAVGLCVVFAADVGDGEVEGPCQLAADPVQGIEAGAAAGVFSGHLPDYYLGVGIDMELSGVQCHCTLQSFQQGNVFSHVVILAADPFCNSDGAALGAVHYHTNSRRPGIPQRASVHVRHHIRHSAVSPLTNMRYPPTRRQDALLVRRFLGSSCAFGMSADVHNTVEKQGESFSHLINDVSSTICTLPVCACWIGSLHQQ
jgi:hypothetical protein